MANFITLDTETANGLDNPIVYDLGIIVHNMTGKVFVEYSFVIKETFYDVELMHSAYYADKIPNYLEDIVNGDRTLIKFADLKKFFAELIRDYNIEGIIAYNAIFDWKALKNTSAYLNLGEYFYPYGIELLDSMKMARSCLKGNKRYNKFCNDNGYKTKNNQNRMTAEVVYRYLTKNIDFIESHTGHEDCIIEMYIFVWCMHNRHRKENFDWKLFKNSNVECKPFSFEM